MASVLKTLIIEDEPAAVNRLTKELNRLKEIDFEILAVVGSIRESISKISDTKDINLIFMDIHLTDGLSFEIFKKVEVNCPIIFTTAYDEYALQAFKVNSIDYLLKPLQPDELKLAIDRYIKQQSNDVNHPHYFDQLVRLASEFQPKEFRSSFLVSFRQKMMMIDIDDVAYLYVKERGVFLRKKDGVEYVVDFFLDDLEKQLDPAKFYRANRQFLISRSSIKEIEPYFNGRLILLANPEAHTSIIVSKEKASHFKKWADY